MKAGKKYLITLAIDIAAALLIMWSKDLFVQTDPKIIFHILCDAFFVVGVVTTSAGLLVFSSNEGTFDMLVYGVKTFMDLFRKTSLRKYDTFYDYRMSKADQKIKFGFLLICGAVFLALSFVMYYFYYQYK